MFQRFLDAANVAAKKNPIIRGCLEKGKSYRDGLKHIRRQGQSCRTQAVWIGLERYVHQLGLLKLQNIFYRLSAEELETFDKKKLVETTELVEIGTKSGVLKGSDNFVLLENQVYRICAPESPEDKMWSIILWTKENAKDNNPCPEKIVCLLLYL